MKKLIIGLLASVLMAAGFVGAATTSANAEQCDRYGVCQKPTGSTNLPDTAQAGERLRVKFKLDFPGDAVPRGIYKQIVKFIGPAKAAAKGKVISKKSKRLNANGAATIATPKLAPGRYQITLKFIPAKNTPWERVNKVRYITVS